LRDLAAALEGDADALERLVEAIQPMVQRLALRFFGCPQHAQDATQEALIQVVTRLDRFAGDSAFTTWVYRVATHKFLSMVRSRAEKAALSFEAFSEELAEPPAPATEGWPVEQALLLEEVKVGCTLAMLLCLERDARMAYILGAIAELDHEVAAEILEIPPATYRKRLQRAREALTGLMRARCGLFDARNACRCSQRVGRAVERGRLDPQRLLFASSAEQARQFPAVLDEIRQLEEVERAAALYRSHPEPQARADLASRLRGMLDQG
jgi:RNA polymerase sigma factor (sigma-70 family)